MGGVGANGSESSVAFPWFWRGLVGLARRASASVARSCGGPDRLLAALFGSSLAVSLALYVWAPIPNGHAYQLGVRVTASLCAIWYLSRFKAHWLHRSAFSGAILAAGVYVSVHRPLTIKPDSEIVAAYASAFQALDTGANPYDCDCVVHFTEHGERKLGNFNYPPLELVPYYGVAKLWGRWDHQVLTATLLCVQLLACAVLLYTFRPAGYRRLLPFVPLLACFELYTNVALTLLTTALVVAVLCARPAKERWKREAALIGLFGVGLLTKFLMIPLFATYAWHRLSFRSLGSVLSGAGRGLASLAVAAVLALPFGLAHVLRETLLFNLVLSERAKLTTFYPNVLSGGLSWLGVPAAFPWAAVSLLGGAVLLGRGMPLLRAMLLSGTVFLLVASTPEPQYLPVMIYLGLAAALDDGEARSGASGT